MEHRRQLQEAIDRLSRDHCRLPAFRAHATLCSGSIPDFGVSLKNILAKVDLFCASRPRKAVKVNWAVGITHRDEGDDGWSTFLFLTLEPDDLFIEAENAFSEYGLKAKRDPEDPSSTLLLPHISFAYCSPDADDIDRNELTRDLTETFRSLDHVVFEGIEVVIPESGRWSNIVAPNRDRWNVVYVRQFEPPKISQR